jgi:DNA polymerase-1
MIMDEHDVKKALQRIRKAKFWIFHNCMFDIRQLRRWAEVKERRVWDTMLVDQVLWGGYYLKFSLKDLVRRYLNVFLAKDAREEFINGSEMSYEMVNYAALDAFYTYKIYECQQKYLSDMDVYFSVEEPAIWPLLDLKPIKIDVAGWQEMVKGFVFEAKRRETALGFNVYSHETVKKMIWKETGLRLKGTGKDILLPHMSLPFIAEIAKTRSYRVMVSTYGEGWLEQNVEEGDLVYPSYKLIGTETGRLACDHPNMQNIPTRDFPEYRRRIIPKQDMITVADISQEETRILAYFSRDKALLKAFQQGEDIHLAITRAAFRDPTIKKVDPRRKIGKSINLGIAYGLTAAGLAPRIGSTEAEAQKLLNDYFAEFKDVRMYILRQHNFAARYEYVETVTGRRVWINLYTNQAENNSINAPIQGSAGDYMKMWMRRVWEKFAASSIEYPLTMNVHDELVSDHLAKDTPLVAKIKEEAAMEVASELFPAIPWAVDVKSGNTWGVKEE